MVRRCGAHLIVPGWTSGCGRQLTTFQGILKASIYFTPPVSLETNHFYNCCSSTVGESLRKFLKHEVSNSPWVYSEPNGFANKCKLSTGDTWQVARPICDNLACAKWTKWQSDLHANEVMLIPRSGYRLSQEKQNRYTTNLSPQSPRMQFFIYFYLKTSPEEKKQHKETPDRRELTER